MRKQSNLLNEVIERVDTFSNEVTWRLHAKRIVKENLTSGFFLYKIFLRIGDNSAPLNS